MALTDNLLAYYKLDWNSNDSLWVINWTDTNVSYVSWKIWNCAQWNWTSSKISQNSNSWITGTVFSISLWFYNSAFTSLKSVCWTWTGIWWCYNIYLWDWGWFWWGVNIDWNWTMVGTNYPSINQWHHVVAVQNWSNLSSWCSIYIDGVLQSITKSYQPTNALSVVNTPMNFLSNFNTSIFNDGKIDEVWIWSRALSSTEITQLYNNGNWLQYPFASEILNPEILLNFLT